MLPHDLLLDHARLIIGSAFAAQAVTVFAQLAADAPAPASWISIGSNVSVVAILALVTKSFLSGNIVRVDVQREAATQAKAHADILDQLAVLREALAQLHAEHTVVQQALTRMERRGRP